MFFQVFCQNSVAIVNFRLCSSSPKGAIILLLTVSPVSLGRADRSDLIRGGVNGREEANNACCLQQHHHEHEGPRGAGDTPGRRGTVRSMLFLSLAKYLNSAALSTSMLFLSGAKYLNSSPATILDTLGLGIVFLAVSINGLSSRFWVGYLVFGRYFGYYVTTLLGEEPTIFVFVRILYHARHDSGCPCILFSAVGCWARQDVCVGYLLFARYWLRHDFGYLFCCRICFVFCFPSEKRSVQR